MPKAEFGEMPTTITAAVAGRLREEIRDGRLPPGGRVRQAHIAAHYGVSTTPVREAFAALEREGLIQSNAHRGVIVFEPNASDLREIYEIRIPLEALATERATSNLTSAELERLYSLIERMSAANRKNNWKLSGELNDEFHTNIYAAAQKPRLLKLISEFRASSRAYIGLVPKFSDRVSETEAEHEAIYEACLGRKPRRAAKAMVTHLQRTVEIVSDDLEQRGTS